MHLHHDPNTPPAEIISFQEFLKIDIRMGTIVSAQPFPEAKKPAYKIIIDFGNAIGLKKSSAQITVNYQIEDLINKKVAAVVNFPPRQVGPFLSEVLIVGFSDSQGEVVLFSPDKDLPNGSRLF